jgi:hypothetical protein
MVNFLDHYYVTTVHSMSQIMANSTIGRTDNLKHHSGGLQVSLGLNHVLLVSELVRLQLPLSLWLRNDSTRERLPPISSK